MLGWHWEHQVRWWQRFNVADTLTFAVWPLQVAGHSRGVRAVEGKKVVLMCGASSQSWQVGSCLRLWGMVGWNSVCLCAHVLVEARGLVNMGCLL